MKKGTTIAGSGSVVGGVFGGILCPACVPLFGSFLTAVGLGALVNFTILNYITIAFLLIGLVGLLLNYRLHKQWYFLTIGVIASTIIYISRYTVEIPNLIYLGGAVLISNVIFDYRALRQCKAGNGKKS